MRIVYLGTGTLAGPTLSWLLTSRCHEVVALVTQPDRTGRGHHAHVNPHKQLAIEHAVPVLQPDNINAPEVVEQLQTLAPDVLVVAAYGQFLSSRVLQLAPHGCINLHASLLPRYRGATPVHRAILNGDAESGVTIIRLVKEMDAGPILGIARLAIRADETTGELESRLADLAVGITETVLGQLASGTVVEVTQDPTLATFAPKLSKPDGEIPWSRSAVEIERHLRGMQPWPAPFTRLCQAGKSDLRLQILTARPVAPPEVAELVAAAGNPARTPAAALPGEVLVAYGGRVLVQTGAGVLELVVVQPDGKRRMLVSEFVRGRFLEPGDRFGSSAE